MNRLSSQALDLLATAALAGYTAVVAVGFIRVFGGWEFIDELLLIVVVGHGVAALLRHAGLRAVIAIPALAVVLAWLIAVLHYRDTFTGPFPGSQSWEFFQLDVQLVQDQFSTAVAPVIYAGGWAVLSSIGVAAVVILADTFAFRADGCGEALVPGGVLFVFVAALGYDRSRVVVTGLLIASGILAAALLRALHMASSSRRTVSTRGRLRYLLPGALGFALACALLAGTVGPRLPGAEARALYKTRGRSGAVTEVLNPLVDIRSRLVKQSNLEMFRVIAPTGAYWRATALPRFDGSTWGLPDQSLDTVGADLAPQRPEATRLAQRIIITGLRGRLLPVAADPVQATGSGLRFQRDTATLVKTSGEFETGDSYEVVSAEPHFQPDQLRAASSSAPPDPIYLELPDSFPDAARDAATQVTAGATTTYDRALALQNWFRSEFTYSLEVQRGHGSSAIESFLRLRVGYCEQFAGTFAAMARSLRIPSRVAVGYTPGREVTPGTFAITGRNAHAWPEIWFDGIGWVPFEPTPGRGAPGAENYTGVGAQQDETPPRIGSGAGNSPPVTARPFLPNDPDAGPTSIDLGNLGGDPTGATPSSQSSGGGIATGWLLVLGLLCAGALAAVVPALSRRWHRRRHRHDVDEIPTLWARAAGAARAAGVPYRQSMTPLEFARQASTNLPVAARPLRSLASALTATVYAPPIDESLHASPYGASLVSDCAGWCAQIEQSAEDVLDTKGKLKRHFTVWR